MIRRVKKSLKNLTRYTIHEDNHASQAVMVTTDGGEWVRFESIEAIIDMMPEEKDDL